MTDRSFDAPVAGHSRPADPRPGRPPRSGTASEERGGGPRPAAEDPDPLDTAGNEALTAPARAGVTAFGYTATLTTTGNRRSGWETQRSTGSERAALRYAEALTRLADATAAQQFQTVDDEPAAHSSPEQTTEIVGVVVTMDTWTSLELAEGAMPTAGPEETAGSPAHPGPRLTWSGPGRASSARAVDTAGRSPRVGSVYGRCTTSSTA